MIISTTATLDNYEIIAYKGIVFGEVISGVNALKDISASFRDFFGGRSATYENELQKAREEAIEEMKERAKEFGANAVVGCKVDYETIGQMLMVTISGTAVSIVSK